jgi:hypothetical protein
MARSRKVTLDGRVDNATEVKDVGYAFLSGGRVLDEGTVAPDGSFDISFTSKKKRVRGIIEFDDQNGEMTRNFSSGGRDYSLAKGEALTISATKIGKSIEYSFRLSDPIIGTVDPVPPPTSPTSPPTDPIIGLPNPENGVYADLTPPVTGREDAGILSIGQQRLGRIGDVNENDWYRVDLQEGRRYEFNDFQAVAGMGDPKLRLYSPEGRLVHDPRRSDDAGGGLNSKLTYTADDTGTYFLVAGGFGGGRHSYIVSYNQAL